jgi:hypothetical protein
MIDNDGDLDDISESMLKDYDWRGKKRLKKVLLIVLTAVIILLLIGIATVLIRIDRDPDINNH